MLTDHYSREKMISQPPYTDNNKIQNVGRAVIHQYKSPHALEQLYTSPPDRLHSLTHCQKCNEPFKEPITLSCGFTLCLKCLPTTSLQCLSFSCLRTHTHYDYKPTTLLENITSQFEPFSNKDYIDLFDCSICLSTLTEPITTQCGHTFCKECLIRTMTDMPTRSCPYCRSELLRIGKVNQLVSGWIDYLNNITHEEPQQSQSHIPIIQVNSTVAFPTQHCLIHITQGDRTLLTNMTRNSHQKKYAICIFSKSNHDFFEYGIMLQINGVEYLQGLHHSVIQASGLFRLRVNHLTVDETGCYTGDVTRLEDLIQDDFIIDHHLQQKPSNVIKTQSTPTHKITRPRPCSMRLSSSAPNHQHYSSIDSCPGSVYRKTWAMDFKKPLSPPPTPTFRKHQPVNNSLKIASLDTLFNATLCPLLSNYISRTGNTVWMMQYEWYLQQSDNRNAIIWWAANILPLSFDEKIMLLSMDSLHKRIIALIAWAGN